MIDLARHFYLPGLLAMVGTLMVAMIQLNPRDGANTLIVFPSTYDKNSMFFASLKAGWLPIRSINHRMMLVAARRDAQASKPAGAWLMLDAASLRGCF